MFEGNHVPCNECGESTWIRVLAPDEVVEIARDLAEFELDPPLSPGADEREEDDYRYLSGHLQRAKEFTAELVQAGQGFLYLVG